MDSSMFWIDIYFFFLGDGFTNSSLLTLVCVLLTERMLEQGLRLVTSIWATMDLMLSRSILVQCSMCQFHTSLALNYLRHLYRMYAASDSWSFSMNSPFLRYYHASSLALASKRCASLNDQLEKMPPFIRQQLRKSRKVRPLSSQSKCLKMLNSAREKSFFLRSDCRMLLMADMLTCLLSGSTLFAASPRQVAAWMISFFCWLCSPKSSLCSPIMCSKKYKASAKVSLEQLSLDISKLNSSLTCTFPQKTTVLFWNLVDVFLKDLKCFSECPGWQNAYDFSP